MRLLLAALLLFISASASAAGCAGTGNCYWVGGTGNFSDTTHWATTNGGATTGSVPTATDNCNFTANSSTANAAYTATVNATSVCLDFVMAGPGGGNKVTWAGNSALNLSGSMNLSGGTAGITRTFTGQLTFVGTSAGKTVTTGGVDLGGGGFSVNGVGGSWQLQDNLTATNSSLALINGALDTNGKTVAVGNLQHSSAGTVTLTLGASTVNLSGAVTCLNLSITGLTFNAGTSTITCGTSSTTINLTSGDSYTFNNLTIASNQITTMTLAANQTVGGTLTLTGAAANTRVAVISSTAGTARTITANAVSLTNVDFQDITGAGAATWSGTRVGDRLGNSGISFTAAVPKFWVGGTGNWSDATNHWATSSGGGPGVNNYPLPQDNVKFDSASNATAYTVTVDQAAFMQDLNFSAAPSGSGTITWAGSQVMTIQGNFTALNGMTRTYTGSPITFTSRSAGKTITNNSVGLSSALTFNGPGGVWQLQDDVSDTTQNLSVTNGTLDTNGKTVTNFGFLHTVAGTAILTLGASAINLSGGSCLTWSATGLTLNAGSSTITCSAATAPTLSSGDSYTFNNLSITFTAQSTDTLTLGANQTINGTLTLAGANAVSHPLVQASTGGTATPGAGPYTITANAVSLTDVDFTDITGAGAATWTGTRLGNCKGNSGITFVAGAPKYYVGNTATWNAVNVWATASGGAGATNNFPLCQDTANLDAGSFSADSQILTLTAQRMPSLTASGTDQAYTIAFSSAPSVYGDVTLDANATISGSSALTMVGRNTQTITSAGKTWTIPLTINSPGGTVKFADAFTTTGNTTLTRGTLDLNGKAISANAFISSNSNTRTIKSSSASGSFTTTSTAAGSVWSTGTTTGFTIDQTNNWTITVSGNTTNFRAISPGSPATSLPAITFSNTTANGIIYFSPPAAGSVTIKSLAISNPPQTVKVTAGDTLTVTSTTFPSGTAGNLVSFVSDTPGTPFTLNKSGGGGMNLDYVSVTDSAATPATPGSTWCAGVNSTNGGGNTGWTFNSSACTGPSKNTGNFLPFLQ